MAKINYYNIIKKQSPHNEGLGKILIRDLSNELHAQQEQYREL